MAELEDKISGLRDKLRQVAVFDAQLFLFPTWPGKRACLLVTKLGLGPKKRAKCEHIAMAILAPCSRAR
jgi:hypothetical protein